MREIKRREITLGIPALGGLHQRDNTFLHYPAQDDGGFAQAPPRGNLLDGGLAQNLAAAQHAIGFQGEREFLGRRQ